MSEKTLKILFEDEAILAIEKPVGIDFHGNSGLVSRIRETFPQALGVHRLDKDTSGIIVFAKNKNIQSELGQLFQDRKVEKYYLALGRGKPSKKQGMIKGDLISTRNGSYKLARSLKNPSITKFSSQYIEENDVRIFFLKPFTGKTHQLRVVLKSLGCPIIGDSRYGNVTADRMYLHAIGIKFFLQNRYYSFLCRPSFGDLFKDKNINREIDKFIDESGLENFE